MGDVVVGEVRSPHPRRRRRRRREDGGGEGEGEGGVDGRVVEKSKGRGLLVKMARDRKKEGRWRPQSVFSCFIGPEPEEEGRRQAGSWTHCLNC